MSAWKKMSRGEQMVWAAAFAAANRNVRRHLPEMLDTAWDAVKQLRSVEYTGADAHAEVALALEQMLGEGE